MGYNFCPLCDAADYPPPIHCRSTCSLLYSFRYASGVIPSFRRKVAVKWLASRKPTASPMRRIVQSGREGSSSFALRSRSWIR